MGKVGPPRPVTGTASIVQVVTISLGVFPFGSYVRATCSFLLLGKPMCALYPLVSVRMYRLRYERLSRAEAGHTPQCVLCPSEARWCNS